jgi:hypothetical protein
MNTDAEIAHLECVKERLNRAIKEIRARSDWQETDGEVEWEVSQALFLVVNLQRVLRGNLPAAPTLKTPPTLTRKQCGGS